MGEKELWAILFGLYYAHRMSRHLLFDLCRAVNAMLDESSVFRFPNTLDTVQSHMKSMIPIKSHWVIFCEDCQKICREVISDEQPKSGVCHHCGKDLKEDLNKGIGIFKTIPVKDQVESFVKNTSMEAAMKEYAKLDKFITRGRFYEAVREAGNFPVSIGSDATPISEWGSKTLYPIILFFQELPPSLQARYPILVAVYCGQTKNKPPPHLMYGILKRELRSLRENPIVSDGVSKCLDPIFAQADCPEKGSVLNQHTSVYFACHVCLEPGKFHLYIFFW